MFQLKPPEELMPRMNVDLEKKILLVDGPNLLAGHAKAELRSLMELRQIGNKSYDTIFAWFTKPDKLHAESLVDETSRILSEGGNLWLIVPKKNSIEHHKAIGITDDVVVPRAATNGLVQKKTLGVGPHLFAIRMMKPAIE